MGTGIQCKTTEIKTSSRMGRREFQIDLDKLWFDLYPGNVINCENFGIARFLIREVYNMIISYH